MCKNWKEKPELGCKGQSNSIDSYVFPLMAFHGSWRGITKGGVIPIQEFYEKGIHEWIRCVSQVVIARISSISGISQHKYKAIATINSCLLYFAMDLLRASLNPDVYTPLDLQVDYNPVILLRYQGNVSSNSSCVPHDVLYTLRFEVIEDSEDPSSSNKRLSRI
jgi:hypothetical protein